MGHEQEIPIRAFPPPREARSIIVFGGTFDPPHVGHVSLPPMARERIGAEWLVYVPAARSPLKERGPLASDEDRVEMLRRSLAGMDRVGISTLEIERRQGGEPSYTLDTLIRFREAFPEASLRLLIGADQAALFHRWREPRRIMGLAEPLVMLRVPHETREMLLDALRAHWSDEELAAWGSWVVELPMVDAEATEIRRALESEGQASAELETLTPAGAMSVIRERGLYGTRPGGRLH